MSTISRETGLDGVFHVVIDDGMMVCWMLFDHVMMVCWMLCLMM